MIKVSQTTKRDKTCDIFKPECRGTEVITGHSSNTEQQLGPRKYLGSELPVGLPATPRMLLLLQHSLRPALSRVSRPLHMH